MNSVADASARILSAIEPLGTESVPVRDALGRVLAAPVVSPLTIPPWDNSAMDGFAVRSRDVAGASAESPAELSVLETVAAGGFPTKALSKGTATRIMTGAPIPSGADAVIRVEDTDNGRDRVRIMNDRDAQKNIRPRGEDIQKGSVVLTPGTPIGPAQIGVLASVGQATVVVHRRPRVSFFGSGDELVDLDRFGEALEGKKVVTSNSYTLHAMIRAAGGEPRDLGLAPDDPAVVRERFDRARDSDLLLTSAGISAGESDYIRTVLAERGVTLALWKVRIRPGAPLGFACIGALPWIGLPGNPVSTMVTFELFVRPVIRKMLGHTHLFRRTVPVMLEEPVTLAAKLTHFFRGVVRVRPDGTLAARLTGPQGSGLLTSMARANALLVVPEERQRVEAGEVVNALLLGEEAESADELHL